LARSAPGDFDTPAAGIILQGGAGPDGGLRAGKVTILALDRWLDQPSGQCLPNAELADALNGLKPDQPLLLALPRPGDLPSEAVFARRGFQDVTTNLRARVRDIAAGRDMAGLFSLAGSQRAPRNVWVNLRQLQSALEQPGRANLLLLPARAGLDPRQGLAQLTQAVRAVVTLDDLGLSLDRHGSEVVLNSRTTFLNHAIAEAAERAAASLSLTPRGVSVYLANQVVREDDGRKLHYCMMAGISALPGLTLGADEIAVNQWTADQLGLRLGDRVRLDYYVRRPNGDLEEVRSDRPGVGLTFRIAAILPMTGYGADPSLTPVYPGLTDAPTISQWDPPAGLRIDKTLVTKDDEHYWDQHRAAPKLFLNLDTARKLWGGVFGDLNSLRLPADHADRFAAELLRQIDPAAAGLAFQPIKAMQMAAAESGTDFGGLFLGFSFFLLAAALLLVAMLFRLGIEQRARQLGLLGALGFAPGRVLRLCLADGVLLAAAGTAIGVPLGLAYTALMLHGLRTVWQTAVGTQAIDLAITPITLTAGAGAAILAALAAIVWGARIIRRVEAARLLAGALTSDTRLRPPGRAGRAAVGAALLSAFVLFGAGLWQGTDMLILAGGSVLLIGLLAALARWLGQTHDRTRALLTIEALGARNAARHRGRSVLTAGLIAFAAYTLVTTAAFQHPPAEDEWATDTGTGGFHPLWSACTFVPLTAWAGQDASCLNMTRPDRPTILAVPPSLQQPATFRFKSQLRPAANPWLLLDEEADGAVPIIADAESAQYILQLKLGQTLALTDQLGRPRQLRLVATLDGSIFQGELLMSRRFFHELFPSQGGFQRLLVRTPPGEVEAARRLLQSELEDYAITIERTAGRLAAYHEVANTYLRTFQTLGSLGLLLGTVGLAVVLLRTLVERRAEMALLAALGFAPLRRLRLVLAENAFLLVAGLAIGAGSAFAGIAPVILQRHSPVDLPAMGGTLLLILGVGLGIQVVTLALTGRRIAAADLRRE
jgi:putative ABC transport system permease protein